MREKQTQLYRHFDADGRLLYIGISLSAVSRLAQHKQQAHWFGEIATVTIEHFGTRKEALNAERSAIAAEVPAHNTLGSDFDPEDFDRLSAEEIHEIWERAASKRNGSASPPQ